MELVFVYGTLKLGYSNHSVLGDSKFIDHGVTEDTCLMYDNGHFPTVTIEDGGVHVTGELFACDADAIQRLDWLESNGTMYTREERLVNTNNNGMMKVWIYLYNDEHYGEQILDGTFRRNLN